jgi:predicted  nucleic acid-binding Zn-ribbon protein
MDDLNTQTIIDRLQMMQRDTEEQISGVRKEMHDMAAKFERAVSSHQELKLDFAVSMERMRASIENIDKNQNEIWSDLHKVEKDVAIQSQVVSEHLKLAEGSQNTRKAVTNWAQWITPLLVSIIGVYISIRMSVK